MAVFGDQVLSADVEAANSEAIAVNSQTLSQTISQAEGAGKSRISFGVASADGVSIGNIPSHGSRLGYIMPTDGKISAVGVNSDAVNSNIYSVRKNGVPVHTMVLASEIDRVEDGLSVPFVQGDVLTTHIGVDGSAFETQYVSDADTLFLAHFDGDTEATRHVTNSATACTGMSGRVLGALVNASGKYGTSVDFDGVDDLIKLLHHKDYAVQDCTVEFYFNADDVVGTQIMFSKDAVGRDTGGHLSIGLVGDNIFVRSQSSTEDKIIQVASSIVAGTWHHVAVVMGAGGIKVFLDGVLIGSDALWTTGLDGNFNPIALGASIDTNDKKYFNLITDHYNGRLDEVRISNSRRYETGFTALGAPFTNDANTLALWHLDETSGFVVFDSSSTITNAMMMSQGSLPQIKTDVIKFGTHAIKMNGSQNDWMRINHNTCYEVSEFTVETWVYPHGDKDDGMIFQKGDSSTEGGLQIKWIKGVAPLQKYIEVTYWGATTNVVLNTGNESFTKSVYHHIAVVVDATSIRVFVNGVEAASDVLSGDFSNVWLNNTEDIFIGAAGDRTLFVKHYYDEFRISGKTRTLLSPGINDVTMLVETT